MSRKPNTKGALILSVLCMVLCVTMLVGSTFAWFTDNASVNVNTIQAGNLDIQLLDATGLNIEGQTLKFIDKDENHYWEPGCTYKLETITLKNAGNLAVKYKVQVTGIEGDAQLNDAIEWTVSTGTGTNGEGHLAANATQEITISGHMKNDAGNEYKNLKIEGASITVLATQDTVEFDSTTDQYDDGADYDKIVSVKDQAELSTALNDVPANTPTVITLDGDADTYQFPTWTAYSGSLKDKTIVFKGSANKTIDASFFSVNGTQNLVGSNLTFDGVTVKFPDNSWYQNSYTGLNMAGGKLVFKNCTISGAQYLYVPTAEFIDCTFENTANSYSVCTYAAANVTFSGCTFNTAGKAVLLYNDGPVTTSVTLTDCVFNSDASAAADKAAVETGDDGSKGSNFTISFTDCEANGFVTNNSTSNLWGNKLSSNMPAERLHVIIDGNVAH